MDYNAGWNAFCKGVPYNIFASMDWRNAWKDAKEAILLGGVVKPLP